MTAPTEQPQRDADMAAQLPSYLGRFVANLARVVDRGIARETAAYELLPLEAYLLMICREMGECTATQLVGQLPVDAARISRLVNGLVDRDLVIRRRPPDNRRTIMLRLSPEGEELADELGERMDELYVRLTAGLEEAELRAFAAAALQIIANYEAMANA